LSRIENKEVSWKVLGIPMNGTITSPTTKEPHSAIVFIAGSGPTDRDWCSPLLPGTNGSGKLLAESFASQGFVTMRYDKLASGPNVRENIPKLVGKISMESHMEELKGSVETLLAQGNVDKDNVFVLTNSEGAIHAVTYQLLAKNNRFKGLVLTGAPGRAVGELGRSQIFEQLKNLPNAQAIMKAYDDANAAFLANKPMKLDASLPEVIKMVLLSLEAPYNLPFSRELWMYRLSEYLPKISEPVQVVIGKKDIQVDWKVDGKILEEATAQKTQVSFVYPENANHVLKHEDKPHESLNSQNATLNYNSSNTELDKEAANAIFDWLKKQTRK
jgi:uncharacterized protein